MIGASKTRIRYNASDARMVIDIPYRHNSIKAVETNLWWRYGENINR